MSASRQALCFLALCACFQPQFLLGNSTLHSNLNASALLLSTRVQSTARDPEQDPILGKASPLGLNPAHDSAQKGKVLFFDRRLSSDKKLSCGDCHMPEKAFSDGLAAPRARGEKLPLPRTPSLWDVSLKQGPFFWNGRAKHLEAQPFWPLFAAQELANTPEDLEKWGGAREVAKNLADYMGTLRTGPAPWDLAIAATKRQSASSAEGTKEGTEEGTKEGTKEGSKKESKKERNDDSTALKTDTNPQNSVRRGPDAFLSPQEITGAKLFFEKFSCDLCHGGSEFSGTKTVPLTYENLPAFVLKRSEVSYSADAELSESWEGSARRVASVPPSLRNLAHKGPPYGRFGQFQDLFQKVKKHPQEINPSTPKELRRKETEALVSFLLIALRSENTPNRQMLKD